MKELKSFILSILSIRVNFSSRKKTGRDKPCPYSCQGKVLL